MSRRVKLSEIASFQTGPFGTQLKASEYSATGTPVINVKNIGYGNLILNDLDYVPATVCSRLSNHLLKKGDIVFGRKGSVDRHCYIKEENENWMQGSDCIRVRVEKGINSRHISYYLMLDRVKKQINNSSVGSTMASINTDILKTVEIILPDSERQNSIAALLTIIDEKIENNNKINAELESMAKTIYDYWFLQFEFPNEDGKPYKSSGGKMVWNEELKREIRAGWKQGTFFDLIEIGNGKDHKGLHNGKVPVYGSGGVMRFVDKAIYDGESVLIPRKGTLNNIIYVNGAFWTVDTMFYSKMKMDHTAIFTYYSVRLYDFEKLNTGTGVPSMTSSIIYDLKTIIPTRKILKDFDLAVQSFYKQIQANRKENEELASLRNFLLPLLMNGQVSFKE